MRVGWRRLIVCVLGVALWCSIAAAQDSSLTKFVRLLLLGDVNLGRTVGQKILKGNVDFPFQKFSNVLSQADIVFANLESQLSDQHGETQNPTSNLIFCGPPQGAETLRRAGVSIVSTANNHAFDYGLPALRETIGYLDSAGVRLVGTNNRGDSVFAPQIFCSNGIRIGFLAYTQFVNLGGKWTGYISMIDSERVRHDIDSLRNHADVVIMSFHGGVEYADRPNENTLRQLHTLADCGADIVVGHHPHVPQGIEQYRQALIFYSLGNVVFYQPQREWTRRSFAPIVRFEKDSSGAIHASFELLPFRAGYQPSTSLSQAEIKLLWNRLTQDSNVSIALRDSVFVLNYQLQIKR